MHNVWHKNDYREKNTSQIYYNKMMECFFFLSPSKTSYNKNKKSASSSRANLMFLILCYNGLILWYMFVKLHGSTFKI